ncbi:MAG: MBOAT family protein [Deltaproteobacteria bacterium]|nr:MBOAT family protein [Deltaproteobacteria bacterium]
MAFNSIEYAILFLTAFSLFWLLHNRPKTRMLVLLVASYIFYASWVPKYLLLIILSSTVDYLTGGAIYKTDKNWQRKILLSVSIIINLGILAIFKYFNFFAVEFSNLMGTFGMEVTPWHLKFLLPVGISFYTFQSLSYTIDIYKKQLEPAKYYYQYLLFVSFFPQLVAGPIVRAKTLLPQFLLKPRLSADRGSAAIFLIATGLVKKVVIADYLGAHLVDPVFSNPAMYSSVEALMGAYAYAFQIYADFSAYSDIAIGSAALLGFEIPINFNAPYTASNLRDFWQRWHISLSTWLRDYLYIPMGGSKKGSIRTYINLALTMVIGGLWHGASLTFLFWGAIHGAALIATRFIQRHKITSKIPVKIQKALGVFLTFNVVTAAWVFFRAPDFNVAKELFKTIGKFDMSTVNLSTPALLILLGALIIHWTPQKFITFTRQTFSKLPSFIQAILVLAAIIAASRLASAQVAPFIYFQF